MTITMALSIAHCKEGSFSGSQSAIYRVVFLQTLSNQTATAIDNKQPPLTKFIALLQYNAIMLMFYD